MHTHVPEASAFLTEHSFLPFPHSCPFPGILVSVRRSTSGQAFITLQHLGLASACCVASALSRPYTLMLPSPDSTLAFQWDDQQFSNDSQREFCSPVKLHPVLLTGAVNPCLPVESLGIYTRNLQKASRHSDRKVRINETPFGKTGKNSSAAISHNQKRQSKHVWDMGTQNISHTSLRV